MYVSSSHSICISEGTMKLQFENTLRCILLFLNTSFMLHLCKTKTPNPAILNRAIYHPNIKSCFHTLHNKKMIIFMKMLFK